MVVGLIIGATGLFYLLKGVALLVAPDWFFATIGYYPPYNRHYAGDAGALSLPLGIGLLLAARHPARQRSVVGIGAGVSLLH
jgi:hypothetical protein